jgi:hypothetical protein
MTRARLSYRFGPLERRGLLGPVRLGQAVSLAAGAIIAIVALDAAPTGAGLMVATVVAGCAALVAIAPVGGRTIEQWAPALAGFAVRSLRQRKRIASPVAILGARTTPGADRALEHPPAVAPPAVGDARIVAAPYRGRELGAISERRGRRLTAVLACRVLGFSLLDAEAQERRLGRWGLVLSGAAGTAIRRLQWLERTAPAQGDELVRWLQAEKDPMVPLRGTPMIESYLELIGTTAKVTQEHEILVAVQVDAQRAAAGRPTAGRPAGHRGTDGLVATLLERTERVAQGLEAAEVVVLGALSPGQLARSLRTAFDPFLRSELATLDAADPDRDGMAECNAWPLGAREAWDHYRSDGALHATYWIGGWPRVDVSPMFMDALLGRSSAVRTVAVTFEPIAPERSVREIEAAVTRDRADRALRHRFGQAETARQRQTQDATVRREAELAAGHGEVRLSGFVTVSGRDPDDLRRACSEVLEHAARARLELHRMYGQQAAAFTFTLPLCRGLR